MDQNGVWRLRHSQNLEMLLKNSRSGNAPPPSPAESFSKMGPFST